MTDRAIRWATPARVMILPVAALGLTLAARSALGIQADPLEVIAAFFGGILALIVAARHPAAFVVPVLFLPRLRDVGMLAGFGPAANWTALQLACMLLGAGVALRWLVTASRRNADEGPFGPLREFDRLGNFRSAGGPVLAFLLFAAVVAFSFLYTAAPQFGFEKLRAFSTLGCAMFLAPFVLFKSESDMRDFTMGTALFAMLVAASSIRFSATGAMGAEDNPAHIGKGQVIGLAIVLLVYTPMCNRWLKAFVLFACMPALAVGLVSAETRGPLFSLSFVLILSFFAEPFRSPLITRKQMIFVGAAIVGAVMLLSAFWFYGEEASKFQYKATEIVSLLEGNSEAKGTAVKRLVYYRAAVNLWTERPVLGWGIGGWSMAYWQDDPRNYPTREYPHNLFLETLVEQGLLGVAALALFLHSIFRYLRICLTQIGPCLPYLLPGLVYLVSIAMFSGDLDDNRFIWFWCGLILSNCSLALRVHHLGLGNKVSARDVAMPAAARVWQACDNDFEDSTSGDSKSKPELRNGSSAPLGVCTPVPKMP